MKNLGMESLISIRLSPSLGHSDFIGTNKINLVHSPGKALNFRKFSIVVKWKNDRYQDFNGYAKPLRLLPANGAKICTNKSSEKLFELFPFENYECLYKFKLKTSQIYGSDLTDVNSGILLCFIGENGSSILQRLPAAVSETNTCYENMELSDSLHFQRGSVDEFVFKGPYLGRIAAVWIGLESGQWRIGGMNLAILSCVTCEDNPEKTRENKLKSSVLYHFEIDDILLGEKTETSMMELRPQSITSFSEDTFNSLDENPSNTSNEESMKEYTNLKLSLLVYDAILVLFGILIVSFSTGSNVPYSFLTGGLVGFIYLFRLQRSVDGLSTLNRIHGDEKNNFIQVFERFGIPISVFVFAILIMKFALAEDVQFTQEDVVFGILGFVMCKVAVILAAFKPIQIGVKR